MEKPALADKATFNQEEAAVFYKFSRRKFFKFLTTPDLPFLFFYNKRKLIDRRKFEEYMTSRPELRETLTVGEWRGAK